MTDNVNHPSHYADGWSNGAEVIDITENLNFNRGNAVKYTARAGKKDPEKELEDLLKAEFYLKREIARISPKAVIEDGPPLIGGVDFFLGEQEPLVTSAEAFAAYEQPRVSAIEETLKSWGETVGSLFKLAFPDPEPRVVSTLGEAERDAEWVDDDEDHWRWFEDDWQCDYRSQYEDGSVTGVSLIPGSLDRSPRLSRE